MYDVKMPNTGDGEVGYSDEPTSEHRDLDRALDAAREAAAALGPRGAVQVVERGTSNVWTVQYRPDAPTFLGLSADGEALLSWPAEFRVTHDPTEQEPPDPDDPTAPRAMVGGEIEQHDEAYEEQP